MKISIKDQAPGPNPNFERNFKLCRFSTDWLLKNSQSECLKTNLREVVSLNHSTRYKTDSFYKMKKRLRIAHVKTSTTFDCECLTIFCPFFRHILVFMFGIRTGVRSSHSVHNQCIQNQSLD